MGVNALLQGVSFHAAFGVSIFRALTWCQALLAG
jgi:hypothetical protein